MLDDLGPLPWSAMLDVASGFRFRATSRTAKAFGSLFGKELLHAVAVAHVCFLQGMANRHLDVGAVLARRLAYVEAVPLQPSWFKCSDRSCFV